MQAFTPTAPPPSAEHLALIKEALCARAAARNKAACNSAQKRRVQFQHELALLRNSGTPWNAGTNASNVAAVSHTGAAAVLQERLTRINPTVPQSDDAEEMLIEQARIDAYNARMSKYLHAPAASEASKTVRKTVYKQPKPLDVEHVLAAAPVHPAIPSAKVVPMIAAHQQEEEAPEEQVQRPSLIDAVVKAFNNFVDKISDKKDEREREPDPVAMGTAAAQVLAVFTSLGKH